MQAALRRPPEPGKWISAVFSVVMHAVLVLVLFYGVQWQRRAPEAVSVELVRGLPSPPAAMQEAPPPQPRPEPRPIPKTEVKPELPKPVAKDAIVLKEAKAKKEPPRPEPPKPEVKPQPPKKVMAKDTKPEKLPEPNTRELENKRINEALDRTLEKLGKTRQEDKLAAAQADASKKRAEAEAAAGRSKAESAWITKVQDKVRGNISLPPGIAGRPTAEIEVEFLPSGDIRGEMKIVKSSGNPALDQAILKSLLKSQPFDKPPQGALVKPNKFLFDPLDPRYASAER